MNPTQRWTVVGVIVLIIALLWLFWPKAEQKPVAEKAPVAAQPSATPVAPAKAAGPVAVTALFDYDSAVLRAGDIAKLDEFAAGAKGGSTGVSAVGHADRI